MSPNARRPLVPAAIVAALVLVALLVVAAVAALTGIRTQATATADDLRTAAAAAADLPERPSPAEVGAFMAAVPAPAALTGRFGQPVARTGEESGAWDRPGPHWTGALAVTGADLALRDGVVEVTRSLPSGRVLTLRRDVGTEATAIGGAPALWTAAAALVVALAAGVLTWFAARRRGRRLAALATAAEAIASGRPLTDDQLPTTGEFGRIGAALRANGERLAQLTEVAQRETTVLGAAIEPLPIPMLGRGPTGARLRNVALDRVRDDLSGDERTALDAAMGEALAGDVPAGTRVTLRDGRILEIDGWNVPGGRLVSAVERTEQERLSHLRRQLESNAVRQLRAPIDEITARGRELYQQVPAPAAAKIRAIFAATDRLDRVVRMLLRGTPHDPALRPPRRETFGVAGLLWGLVHDWDSALRQRALRVELDIAPELPDVRTDPALVEEILTELVDNSAKYTPRGGTVALSAQPGEGCIVIDVRDSGTGFAHEDVPHATERFFRGRHAESIPGAGLGLGVAAALAERLGARLIVQPGPGGHVRLELPVRSGRAAAAVGAPG